MLSGKSLTLLALVSLTAISPVVFAVTFGPTCSVTITGENVGNNAIQLAINNAINGVTGKVVCVSPGTYPEQLTISTIGSHSASGIQLVGVGGTLTTIIQPTTVAVVSNSPDTNNPEAPVILVGATGVLNTATSITGVVIKNIYVSAFKADGAVAACSPQIFGILYLNAGGTITSDAVNGTNLGSSSYYGCQSGNAIQVQTGAWNGGGNTQSGDTSNVKITSNTVTNYQKNGITCNDPGTTCNGMESNTVSPLAAATPFIAPNGIQIGFGAVGNVNHNIVSGNVCTLAGTCGPNLVSQTQGTGILTYQSGAGTVVGANTLSGNDIGIAGANDATSITSNTISSSTTAAILLYDGTGTYTVKTNTFTASANPIGVAVESDGFVGGGYTGSFVSSISGSVFNTTPIKVQGITLSPGTATINFGGLKDVMSGGDGTNPAIVSIS